MIHGGTRLGGRGASGGWGVGRYGNPKNPYGSQCHALLTVGNIKFVSKNGRNSETLMETMTRGRVYAHVEGDDLKAIGYFGNENKRSKQIGMDHAHLGISPHAHDGYFHSKFRKNPATEERAMVDRVVSEWKNYKKGK